MVRIGRGLTPYQETIGAFEPFHSLPNQAGFYTDLAVAGYNSAPLDPQGFSNNRWANGFWYNSPVVSGFQVNTAIATKEANGGFVVGRGTALHRNTRSAPKQAPTRSRSRQPTTTAQPPSCSVTSVTPSRRRSCRSAPRSWSPRN